MIFNFVLRNKYSFQEPTVASTTKCLILLILTSCGTSTKTEDKISPEKAPTYRCYGSYTDKDSVFLQIAYEGDNVRGDLIYKLYEKDKNIGSVEGKLHHDTIYAVYKFNSEGKQSEREVAFLQQGDNLIEGFAPMNDSGTRFKNRNELEFIGTVLTQDECR